MFKAIVLSIIATVAFAEIPKFPAFDMFHANCALDVTYTGQTCSQVYSAMETVITNYEAGDAGAGVYAFVDKKQDTYFWVTRETPTHHYIDDIGFEFTESNGSCTVTSKSRSETLSVYDYSTNYCNMWNVLNTTGVFANTKVHDCAYPAADPTTTCAKY